MLPVPIETLRVRIGLESSDASRDTDIQTASDTALALMAIYCDRYFDELIGGTEIFTHVSGETLGLKRYPVTQIQSMVDSNTNDVSAYHLGELTGIIHFDVPGRFHELTVVTDAGYAEGEFPDDLMVAYYQIFDQQMLAIETGGQSASNIESVTVADVGTVRYGSTDASSGSYVPPLSQSILDAYKRYEA
ncbi:MAG: hypothetical protein DRH90_18115 [Deltaproteobacteria bacterium]|nr:MAG: hypothetical protein DRH90_18115 [Deltaproteobacteria bacterium]RLC10020.1 MAG: hypothetical protein DRI24_20885 [Deltaproteobacteria bacterium]